MLSPAVGSRRPLHRVLVSESGRQSAALAVALVVTALVAAGGSVRGASAQATLYAVLYAGFLTLYSVLTLVAFRVDFAASTAESPARTGPLWRRCLKARPGSEVAVAYSALALAYAVLLALVDGKPGVGPLTAATTVLVVGAWVTVAVTYAADYARRTSAAGGLDFPGAGPVGLSDHLYFALSVSTTFGTTDVSVTSASLRRVVMTHAVVAFVMNTVILALLVSTLLG